MRRKNLRMSELVTGGIWRKLKRFLQDLAGMLFLNQLRAQMLSFAPSSPAELTKIQRQWRSYGNIVSLPSLKTKILCQTRFSTTVAIVATGAIIWKPGFRKQKGCILLIMHTKYSHESCNNSWLHMSGRRRLVGFLQRRTGLFESATGSSDSRNEIGKMWVWLTFCPDPKVLVLLFIGVWIYTDLVSSIVKLI